MIIDYKKILNIKNIKQLKHYKLDKPIFLNNYLFHYLIMLGNYNALKLTKFPIHIENTDGLNGFHIAAKENNLEILSYLIDTYPDYIYNKDKHNNAFTYYLEMNKIYILIKKYPKLNWDYLIPNNVFNVIINNLNYSDLKKFLSVYKKTPEQHYQYLFQIIHNNNINTKLKIKIFDTFSDDEINIKEGQYGLIFVALDLNNKLIFDYLLKRNIDIDYYYSVYYNILLFSIDIDLINNTYYYSQKIIEKLIKTNPTFMNETNFLHDNIAHSLLFRIENRQNDNYINNSYFLNILKYCDNDCWNQPNNEKITPLELLSQLDYNIYSKLITGISINKDVIKKIKDTKIDKRWIKLYESMDEYKYDDNKIKINNYEYKRNTKFAPTMIIIFLIILYFIDNFDVSTPIIDSHLLENVNDNNITFDYFKEYISQYDIIKNNPIISNIIIYYSKKKYYIHPYLNNIVNSYKKRFLFVFLSLIVTPGHYHANILIYDYKNMTIERFEPAGIIHSNQNTDIDIVLDEELTWNTGFRYISPREFMQNISFQSISDENNIVNLKYGDTGGFCASWCFWYLETKLLNPDVDPKTLVNKLIKKLNNLDIKFSEYIRNYANKLDIEKNKYLEIIGINPNNYYDDLIHKDPRILDYIIKRYSTISLQ
jgi:hypothetical protein